MKERLFRLGVDPRVVSSANGHTLLHAACGFDASRVAKLVVRRAVYESHPPFRAFLDKRANDGSAALDVATNAGFERIAEWLTALGASSGFRSAFDSGSRRRANTPPRVRCATTDPALYPPAFYPPAFAPAHHVGVGIAISTLLLPVWTRTCSARWSLCSATSRATSRTSRTSRARASAGRASPNNARRDDRARARRLVKRVAAELAEDRDDYRADLETALRRAERAEAKLAKTRDELRVAEARAFGGGGGGAARRRAAEGGGAEPRCSPRSVWRSGGAVRMAAERETLREERDAIAEALAFVKEETKTLFSNTERELFLREASGEAARELRDGDGDGDELSRRRDAIRDPGSGIRDRTGGGGLGNVPNPERGSSDTGDDTEGTAQMLEVPLGD